MQQRLNNEAGNWVLQEQQLGTGHAMQQAAPFLMMKKISLMVYGDTYIN